MRMPFAGEYRLTQGYGSNKGAYERFGMLGHNGVDWALPGGTALSAVRDGTWRRYADPTGYGVNGVLTDADGGQWLYAHLRQHAAADGARVAEGDRVAVSDNTGNSTGNHLHFGYRPRGYDPNNGYFGWVNPKPLLPYRRRVLLQAAHNGDGSGAPREAEWTGLLAGLIRLRLEAAGVETAEFGGFYDRPIPASAAALLGRDWDLCLCLHYDGQGGVTLPSGCCVAYGSAETMHWEAADFQARWIARYPAATGIPLKQSRVGVNMRGYYVWRHTSYVTPGVIVEHGYGQPGVGGDAARLWDDIERVAAIDAAAVLEYLGVPNEVADQGIVDELNRQIEELRATVGAKDSAIGALTHDVIAPQAAEIAQLKAQLAASGAPGRRAKRIEYDDGSTQEVAA
jgi:hypothetical protein